MIIREPASTLNVVALGLVAGLVAFITFSALGPDYTVAAGGATEPAGQESQHDNVYGEPLGMP